jgi:hypothetical protein
MARRRWVPEVTAGTIAIDGKNFPPIPLDLIRFMSQLQNSPVTIGIAAVHDSQ